MHPAHPCKRPAYAGMNAAAHASQGQRPSAKGLSSWQQVLEGWAAAFMLLMAVCTWERKYEKKEVLCRESRCGYADCEHKR